MANTYNAAQIIGKTLYAFQDINLKREPSDSGKTVFTVKQGQPVGIVYSYLMPKEGRSNLYWVFKDANGREYYAEHKTGLFDFKALQGQGAKDTETIIKEQQEAAQPAREFWSNKALQLGALVLVAYLLKEPIKNALK